MNPQQQNPSQPQPKTSHAFSLIIIVLLIIAAALYISMIEGGNGAGSAQPQPVQTQSVGQQTNQPVADSLANGSAIVATTTIAIPLLIDANDPMLNGQIVGCDKVVMTPEPVPADFGATSTTALLDFAYQTLFADRSPWPPVSDAAPGAAGETAPLPGNFIETQTALHFDHVRIQNGVANVYLTGSIGPLSGECDDTRIAAQIDAVALQFSGVTGVQAYLNNATTSLTSSEK